MRTIFRRFFELIGPFMGFSALVTYLYTNAFIPMGRSALGVVMLFLLALYLMYNGNLSRICYEELDDSFEYSLCTISAYALFLVINIVFYVYADVNTYTWFFALSKTVMIVFEEVSNFWSFVIIQLVVFVVVLLTPFIGRIVRGLIYD